MARPEQGAASRRVAARLVHGVLVLGRPLDRQLEQALDGLGASDRGLAHALAMGVLRHLPALDALIDSACRVPPPADSRARMALRIALAGRLLLDTPAHAAIATALPLVEGGPRRLVHGVLGTLFRQALTLPAPRLPDPWHERWAETWGEPEALAAARVMAAVPPTDLAFADLGAVPPMAGVRLRPGHLRLAGSRRVEELPGYADGGWWVQDIAAQLPAALLGDVAGRQVLDLCAAPGGKTMQLAAAGARVTAVDISGPRLQRLARNLARTRLSAETVRADALRYAPAEPFDAVLLDAPCSASGTFRRHPDVLHLKATTDLGPLVLLQRQLRERAAGWLKPGGMLVYAVCSLERAEGEAHDPPPGLLPEPIAASELPAGLFPTPDGTVRTLPSLWHSDGGADGFFIARYRKPG